MKLIHLSDLHIGKRVNEFSMLEDQKYILKKIIGIILKEKADAVLIAGDVYDKSVPSAEAVQLFDDFLCRLAEHKVEVFIISGNHDSPERLSFGGRLMEAEGIHISPVYGGHVEPITLTDGYGELNFYLLPFIKPISVKRFFPEDEINSYTDAVSATIREMNIDPTARNILLTHQFVTGASRSESEEISVGGSDNVDASVFEGFDYVALGHIHGPQKIGRDTLRYCGTPLKYSFSEAGHKKSVTVVEFKEKGNLTLGTIPLEPLRDMREIRGTYADITLKSNWENTNIEDYIHITLTDEEDIPDAIGKLRVIYPNLMKLDYDNRRTRSSGTVGAAEKVESKSPMELFAEFYEKQNNSPLSEEQSAFMQGLIAEIWEGEK
ncbi:MAG: exonuclease SbcCD subunit D [Clostridia bacterium]|nr:exonuclease SbcCD subunit D [Clostridia bacterium]